MVVTVAVPSCLVLCILTTLKRYVLTLDKEVVSFTRNLTKVGLVVCGYLDSKKWPNETESNQIKLLSRKEVRHSQAVDEKVSCRRRATNALMTMKVSDDDYLVPLLLLLYTTSFHGGDEPVSKAKWPSSRLPALGLTDLV